MLSYIGAREVEVVRHGLVLPLQKGGAANYYFIFSPPGIRASVCVCVDMCMCACECAWHTVRT